MTTLIKGVKNFKGSVYLQGFQKQGWCGDEIARLPPMCPGFDSRTQCHTWAEFVVGSRPCSRGFSPSSQVFLPPQKSTFLNSNLIRDSRATGLSVSDCYVLPSLNKVDYY